MFQLNEHLIVYRKGEEVWVGFDAFAICVKKSGNYRVKDDPCFTTYDVDVKLKGYQTQLITDFEQLHEVQGDVHVGDIIEDIFENQLLVIKNDFGFIVGIDIKTKQTILVPDVSEYNVYSLDDLIGDELK